MTRWLSLAVAVALAAGCHHHRLWHDRAEGSEVYEAYGLEVGQIQGELRYHIRWDSSSELSPVVLLHGNFDSVDTWERMVVELPRDVPLVLLEIPGFGTSPALEATGPVEHAHAVAAALEEPDLPPVVLGGHSLGGMLAAQVAQHHPERVSKLVMISAGYINHVERPVVIERVAQVMKLAELWGTPNEGVPDPLAEPVRELLLHAVHRDELIDDNLVLAYEERVVAGLDSAARLSGDG